jgi:HTH-type transcriptional regulator, transcriptional repressor of NAD biosynthesis genes
VTGIERGLVVGKFLPPHAGHHHVIARALEECARVDVVVCDLPGQRPPASARAGWLEEIHPSAQVSIVPDICGWHGSDPCPPECSERWAAHLDRHGLGPWSAVYGSEAYISRFAPLVGAIPVLVDPYRSTHPVSGTAVRADLPGAWAQLHPVVRAGLTRRVVILGAESTGTTTLARDLAARLGVPWVAEYGRQFSEQRAVAEGSIWDVPWHTADFLHIADRQVELEADTIRSWVADPARSRPGPLGPLVVCDTDVLATAVWHRRYCGATADELVERARHTPPLFYVLTSPAGVPFVQDGLRDGEEIREEMTTWFREPLEEPLVPWIEVVGSPSERVDAVLAHLEQITVDRPVLTTGQRATSGRHEPRRGRVL